MHDTTTKKGAIIFSYDNGSLFNDVSLLSAYMVKNMKIAEGSALDEYSISKDEQDIFNECLKQTLPDLYETVIQFVPCGDGAFSDGLSGEGKIKISVKNNNAYNVNVLTLVDATIYECLKQGILSKFYSICVNDALFSIANGRYAANVNQLKQRLFQLRKKSISSQI